jgi:hypothetical protein
MKGEKYPGWLSRSRVFLGGHAHEKKKTLQEAHRQESYFPRANSLLWKETESLSRLGISGSCL